MKNVIRILIISLLFVSCNQQINPEDVTKINGYWEIEKVVFEDGKEKQYGMNESYDYFLIDKSGKGWRKKVMPQLDGTFLVNDSFENVKIRFTDDKTFLDYATNYTKWSEEILVLTDKELVVVNAQKKEYHYKKAAPINLLEDGKKVK